ncbi:LysR family transcriptional regulator [Photorhabdus luminescens]|uniref:LysR family transcriptional regulator n=2 Tax=Photorhabdus luminescens TaxID=29488 RepID=A0A5C4RE20_PHOLU|nr:LysR family transcriptional regulator [Photorhabdus luminescens]OWO79784.1 transcriptional regulator [Photorhabdus luminescens]TDB48357.1 LysR family transcriptional regulator [Photorhabdus luminescens subsp. mexicana]TNH42230.1 LysR family transcriptional regulator [Photorhabdus luminescens subsp. sonorensis]
MDKLRAISVFRRVVELGSFKAAAQDLGLSKAAISKNIKELEEHLKSPLINRTTRNMHITASGRNYYHQVCNILDELENADLSVMETSHALTGSIKVSIPMSIGLKELNPLICQFMHAHPGISVEVVMIDKYIDLIEHGIDVAIRGGGELSDSSLRSRKLIKVPRVLCASPAYIEASEKILIPENLTSHNCLIYSLSSSPRRWMFHNQNDVKVVDLKPGTYVVNNGLALKQAALAGHGVVLLPELLVIDELQSGELVRLLPEWEADTQALYAIQPFHKERSIKARAFIDFLVNALDDTC